MNKNYQWMIYGATGYSGELIARQAVADGKTPILAGRNNTAIKALAEELGLKYQIFDLDDDFTKQLKHLDLVLNCAGPFSATAEPVIKACLKTKTHYLDITGEIAVFELAASLSEQAHLAQILIIPGCGFDVIPTDCIAAKLKAALPDGNQLQLGFSPPSGASVGSLKTVIEIMGQGAMIRKNKKLQRVPHVHKVRKITFTDTKEEFASTIAWGDLATAYYSTEIPNIEVYLSCPPKQLKSMRQMNYFRPIIKLKFVQNFLKKQVDKYTKRGPDAQELAQSTTYLWGQISNPAGKVLEARLTTPHGYALTITGGLAMVDKVVQSEAVYGYKTPSQLGGADFVSQLPKCGPIEITPA